MTQIQNCLLPTENVSSDVNALLLDAIALKENAKVETQEANLWLSAVTDSEEERTTGWYMVVRTSRGGTSWGVTER